MCVFVGSHDLYLSQVNVPKPQAIVVRLFVMLNTPFRRNNLGTNILEALRAIGPVLHPGVTGAPISE